MKCVVLVPGIMGSRLENDAGRVWPPSTSEIIFGYKRLAQLLDPNLRVTAIIRRVGIASVYKTLLNDIRACGYAENDANRRFVPFPYDWRLSNMHSADLLAARLENELSTASNDLAITLVAHSMGGLVCRYLLESGKFTGRSWFEKITQLITLGTPHIGAPLALKRLSGEENFLGLSAKDVRTMGNDPRYPAPCELVGIGENGLTIRQGARGALPDAIDPLTSVIAQTLQINAQNIHSAVNFWHGLDTQRRPAHCKYYCVVGSALKTVVRSEIQTLSARPEYVERRDSGDGTVPMFSAALPNTPHRFSRKKHSAIFEDRDVRTDLYHILDAPVGVKPQAADTAVELGTPNALGISVNKESYSVGENIEVAVSYNKLIANPRESFDIIKYDANSGQPDTSVPRQNVATRFTGTELWGFSFTIKNNLEPGLYEIRPSSVVDDPEPSFFFVQGTADGNA